MIQTTDVLFASLCELHSDHLISAVSESIGAIRVSLPDGSNSGFGPSHLIDFRVPKCEEDGDCSEHYDVCIIVRQTIVIMVDGKCLGEHRTESTVIDAIKTLI